MDYFTILKAISTILVIVLILSFVLFLFGLIDWLSFALIMGISGVFSFFILPKLAIDSIRKKRY